MRQSKVQKREKIKFFSSRRFLGFFPPSSGFTALNYAANEKLYNFVTATEREECHVVFPSLTIQNPEEGETMPAKRRLE